MDVPGGIAPSTFGQRIRYATTRLAAAQKPGAGEPAYLRWINRPIGRRLAAVSYALGMTPNQVTIVSGLVSAAAILVVALVPATWGVALVAAVTLLLGYALDSADGQLARLRGGGNIAGEWLDHVVDAARLPALHLALAWALLRDGQEAAGAVAMLFALVSTVWFFGQILAGQLLPRASVPPGSAAPRAVEAGPWVSLAKLPYDVGTLYLSVALLAATSVFVVVYSLLFLTAVAGMVLSLGRKWTVLRSMSRPAG